MTVGILFSYMIMLILVACVDDPDFNPFGECGGSSKVNATDISLLYEQSNDYKPATETDTVKFEEFGVYLKLNSELISQSSFTSSFPGSSYALSCAPNLDFQNITSISMTLLAPYGGKEAGTNISNLVTTHEGIKLSDLRNFKGSMGQYKLTIDLQAVNKSQLKTKTTLKLKDGTEKFFESTSPVLLIN